MNTFNVIEFCKFLKLNSYCKFHRESKTHIIHNNENKCLRIQGFCNYDELFFFLLLYSKTTPGDDHSAATSSNISTRWCFRPFRISEFYVFQFDSPTWVTLAAIKIDSYRACWSSLYVFIWYSAYLHTRILFWNIFIHTIDESYIL